jgi:hypothetical protein
MKFDNLVMVSILAAGVSSVGFIVPSAWAVSQNPEIKVGILQRFGQQPKDQVLIQAQPGDRLTLTFWGSGKPMTTVPLSALDLKEGWDLGLLTPAQIQAGEAYSAIAQRTCPMGAPHRTILLDFLGKMPFLGDSATA